MGIKPFYFMENEVQFYFASEMKSLYCCEKDKVNPEALQHYFTFQYVPEPYTMQENINKLQLGCFFRKTPGQSMHITSFAHLNFDPKDDTLDDQLQKIQDTLRESGHLHMLSNLSVGALFIWWGRL